MFGRFIRLQLAALTLACQAESNDNDEDAPRCVEVPAQSCTPLYPPQFEHVFANTLLPNCASGGGACHGTPDALGAVDGGLYFDEPSASYTRLLSGGDEDSFVIADDPSCSTVIVRMMSASPELRMPPGAELDLGELCSITQWIAQGAQP